MADGGTGAALALAARRPHPASHGALPAEGSTTARSARPLAVRRRRRGRLSWRSTTAPSARALRVSGARARGRRTDQRPSNSGWCQRALFVRGLFRSGRLPFSRALWRGGPIGGQRRLLIGSRGGPEQQTRLVIPTVGDAKEAHLDPSADRDRRMVVQVGHGPNLLQAIGEAACQQSAGRLAGESSAPAVGVQVPADLDLAVAVW